MIYDYKITTGKGETIDLSDYKVKVIMIVNTATEMLQQDLNRLLICRRSKRA